MFHRQQDEHSFTGGYTTVKEEYVRKKKRLMRMKQNGFVPLDHVPGDGQVDFGEHIYYDAEGAEQKGYALTLSFPYSNKGYPQTFPSQN